MSAILRTAVEWESMFAPYDTQTYDAALAALSPNDIVLDIGAGDLRFAIRAAQSVRQVIAIERRSELLPQTVPDNVNVVCADARGYEFPSTITAAVLLMRHCQHFALYRRKLKACGCTKLITNARWGMDVEVILLRAPRISFAEFVGGWYACACGSVGFKPHDDASDEFCIELENCPACA